MFLNEDNYFNTSIFSSYSFLNEADDAPTDDLNSNEYDMNMDDAPDVDGGNEENNAETEPKDDNGNQDDTNLDDATEEEPNEDEYDMNMDDAPDVGGTDEENADDSTTEDTSNAGAEEGEIEDASKKYILLIQYKDLFNTVNKLLTNIEKYFGMTNNVDYNEVLYVFNQARELEKRILFTITNKFDKFDYQKLLTLFFYFQEQSSNLIELLEKIIDEEKEE